MRSKPTFMKGIVLGATVGAVIATVTVAAATTLPFTLGTTNRENAATQLTNVAANGKPNNVPAPILALENTASDPRATALRLNVAPGHAPFITNSSTKVGHLNVDRLDGIDSTGFVQGAGHVYNINTNVFTNDSANVLTIPSFLTFTFFCNVGQDGQWAFQTTASSSVNVIVDNGSGTANQLFLGPSTSAGSSFWNTTATDSLTFSFAGGGKVATANLSNYPTSSPLLHRTECGLQGTITVNG